MASDDICGRVEKEERFLAEMGVFMKRERRKDWAALDAALGTDALQRRVATHLYLYDQMEVAHVTRPSTWALMAIQDEVKRHLPPPSFELCDQTYDEGLNAWVTTVDERAVAQRDAISSKWGTVWGVDQLQVALENFEEERSFHGNRACARLHAWSTSGSDSDSDSIPKLVENLEFANMKLSPTFWEMHDKDLDDWAKKDELFRRGQLEPCGISEIKTKRERSPSPPLS